MTLEDIHSILKKRKKTSHKGDNGKVLAVGGSTQYVGAIALAGLAALRAGCDLVTVAAPKKVAWAINCLTPDLITHKINCEHFETKNTNEIIKLAKNFDVVLIGNGLGLKSEKFVKKIVKKVKKPIVIDADAIKSVSLKELNNTIITPHAKELEILIKNSGYERIIHITNHRLLLRGLQRIIGTNVLLIKGRVDTIISNKQVKFNRTGNEGMTKAGTGDTLAGLCAGFLAQSKDLMKSASAAAWINGHIGDLLMRRKHGPFFLASDIVEDIKKIF